VTTHLVQRLCVLNYFNVVVNKSSHLSMVDYQITKINGFFKRGWRSRGKASSKQASEGGDKGKLIRQTLVLVRQITPKSYLGQTINVSLKTKFLLVNYFTT
jgi:hypothetical protein